MRKKIAKLLFALILTITLSITFSVNAATSKTVNNQSELKEALNDSSISTIILGSDIETTEKINIMRPVTIDGANHTIKYVGTFGSSNSNSNSNTVWGGIYVLQVYKTEATIKDIKLTGGNAALLINGSTVTLEGKIDVSGNGFGGIELGKGSNVDTAPYLILADNSEIINTTETSDKPTIWVPADTDGAMIEIDGIRFDLEKGEELTLQEINDLANSVENPETNDPIILHITFLILTVILSSYAIKKFTSKED